MEDKRKKLGELLISFDGRLADFEEFLETVAEATGDDLERFTEPLGRIRDKVYESIRLASPPEG